MNEIRVCTRCIGDVTVMRIEGDVSTNAEEPFRSAYEAISASGAQCILLSFREGDYMDSAGIAVIILLAAQAQRRGQVLRIALPSAHFRQVFTDIMKLDKYADIFPSEEEALQDFGTQTSSGAV